MGIRKINQSAIKAVTDILVSLNFFEFALLLNEECSGGM